MQAGVELCLITDDPGSFGSRGCVMSNEVKLRPVSQDELNRMLQAAAHSNDNSKPKVDFDHLLIENLVIWEYEFQGVDFSYTCFKSCKFNDCKFVRSNLHSVKFTDCEFHDLSCFQYTEVKSCEFNDCKFLNTDFYSVKFTPVYGESAKFTDCEFDEVDFLKSSLEYLTLERCQFHFCLFRGAERVRFFSFGGAHLKDCDLTGVDLQFCRDFVLDNTVTPGMRLPVRSRDPWSQLVRSYTGANLLFNFLFLAAFFTPFVIKGVGLIALSRAEARLTEKLALLAEKTAQYPFLVEIQQALNPCAASRCEPIPVWRVLLGYDVSPWVFWIGIVLLLYNGARAFLTWRIAPLKEEEVVSGRSPYFLPRWPKIKLWRAVQHRNWTDLNQCKEELWHAYAPLWWIHKVIQYTFYVAIIAALWHFIGFFQEKVYLPASM
jgi:uncharacterized protein YjbI with pentapeptide repeats